MKTLRVSFSDGSQYDIPVRVILINASEYYHRKDPDYPQDQFGHDWSDFEIGDWATNNMNWCEVAPHAVQVKPPDKRDMDELWSNADTEVVTI